MGLAGALGLLALLPAYWALGGTWGLMEAMGNPEPFHPPAWAMWLTALLLFGWMMVVFGAIGTWGGDAVNRFCRLGCCVMALALLGVACAFFESETVWEQMVLGPALLLLALLAAVLVRDETRMPKLLPW
ncbi:MAG TPA: DUF3995 domain-containing protein [Longimicrobium sp.]|nr:DUF3995 domain-containing protein [Longimicrobium sp.]